MIAKATRYLNVGVGIVLLPVVWYNNTASWSICQRKLQYKVVQIWSVFFVPFAENLKYAMQKLEISNYKLAKEVGCSQSSIKNWLDGDNLPHTKTRIRIAQHFGLTLEELDGEELPVISGKSIKKDPAVSEVVVLSEKDVKFIKWFRSLSPEKQKAILTAQDGPVELAD